MSASELLCGHCKGGNGPVIGISSMRQKTIDIFTGRKIETSWYGEQPTCKKCWNIYSQISEQEHKLERFGKGIEIK